MRSRECVSRRLAGGGDRFRCRGRSRGNTWLVSGCGERAVLAAGCLVVVVVTLDVRFGWERAFASSTVVKSVFSLTRTSSPAAAMIVRSGATSNSTIYRRPASSTHVADTIDWCNHIVETADDDVRSDRAAHVARSVRSAPRPPPTKARGSVATTRPRQNGRARRFAPARPRSSSCRENVISPDEPRRGRSKPVGSSTRSIAALLDITSASNRWIPGSAASAANCSSIRIPVEAKVAGVRRGAVVERVNVAEVHRRLGLQTQCRPIAKQNVPGKPLGRRSEQSHATR